MSELPTTARVVIIGGWGYPVGASIALGMLRLYLTEPGTKVGIEILGARFKTLRASY